MLLAIIGTLIGAIIGAVAASVYWNVMYVEPLGQSMMDYKRLYDEQLKETIQLKKELKALQEKES